MTASALDCLTLIPRSLGVAATDVADDLVRVAGSPIGSPAESLYMALACGLEYDAAVAAVPDLERVRALGTGARAATLGIAAAFGVPVPEAANGLRWVVENSPAPLEVACSLAPPVAASGVSLADYRKRLCRLACDGHPLGYQHRQRLIRAIAEPS